MFNFERHIIDSVKETILFMKMPLQFIQKF